MRDDRVENFRRVMSEGGRFTDGVTDALYRVKRALMPVLGEGYWAGESAGMGIYSRR